MKKIFSLLVTTLVALSAQLSGCSNEGFTKTESNDILLEPPR